MGSKWSPPVDYKTRPVVVLGGGVLGRRIAACFVAAGYHVRIRDPSEQSRTAAITYIKENISSFLALTNGRTKEGTYEGVEDLTTAVKDAWIVFEAVPEILSLKESTFAELERTAPVDCILATNSSSFKSGDLLGKVQEATKARVLNTHFMMPPQAIVVELMTSGHTAPEIFPFVEARHREAGLHPVTALKESSGFIFNRIWAAIKRECLSVLAEGVSTPEVIDSIWKEQYGSAVGPCEMMDGVGLDTVEHIEQHYVEERKMSRAPLEYVQQNFVANGRLGLKTPDKGGLYPPPKPGTQTKLLFLNVGLNEPLGQKSSSEYMHGGEVLSVIAEHSGGRATALISGQALPDGIDTFDGRIYWTNMGVPSENDGTVQSAKLDGSDIKTLVPVGEVHTPKQCHVDREGKKLYFCDREGLRVFRCNLDGSEREVIIQTGDWKTEPAKVKDQRNWCVGVTISRRLNKFFWTQKGSPKGSEGRIFSASLELPNGSTPSNRPDIEVVQEHLPECIDLEMDDEAGVLYWTDRGEVPLGNTLNKKQLIGEAPPAEKTLGRQIIAQGLGEAIGLKLDKALNCVYVADMAGRVWKCSLDGGLKEKIHEGPTGCYTGLTFVKV